MIPLREKTAALSYGSFRSLKKPMCREMSARGYAIHSLCPQLSFSILHINVCDARITYACVRDPGKSSHAFGKPLVYSSREAIPPLSDRALGTEQSLTIGNPTSFSVRGPRKRSPRLLWPRGEPSLLYLSCVFHVFHYAKRQRLPCRTL